MGLTQKTPVMRRRSLLLEQLEIQRTQTNEYELQRNATSEIKGLSRYKSEQAL